MMMNINILEKEILKAIDIEKEACEKTSREQIPLEDIRKFIVKLFIEYKGEEWWMKSNM